YHKPLRFLRSQARGTSTSRIRTASARPPWRRSVCSVAQKDLAGVCNQTTGSRPWLLQQSRPRRSMPGRLRKRVAWRNSLGPTPSLGRPGAGASPACRPLLQPPGRDQGGQAIDVFAMPVARVPLALAGRFLAIKVDVVRLLGPDLLQPKTLAEVTRDETEEV